jgi:hypothetical protein
MDWASELIITVLLSMILGLVGQPPIPHFDTFFAVLEEVFWLFLGEPFVDYIDDRTDFYEELQAQDEGFGAFEDALLD